MNIEIERRLFKRFYAGIFMDRFLAEELVTGNRSKDITENRTPELLAEKAKILALALDKAMNENEPEFLGEL